jgi:hypothetical protein
MYVFEDRVKIKPRFGFAKMVEQVGLERFKIRFEEAVAQALASAK